MKTFSLKEEEKTALEHQHRQSRDAKERDRIKAVLLNSEGWETQQIAQALRIHRTAVSHHIKDYQASKKLSNASGGIRREYLDSAQTQSLIAHLESTLYQHNYQIVAYIKQHCGVVFTVSGLDKWLHRHGFRYKKPKGMPYKADKAQQQAFIKQYEALKTELNKDDSIVFMDAVHPTQATKLSYGWIRQGQDKAIPTNGSRTRLNIIGGIRLDRLNEAVVQRYDRVDSETIVAYLQLLRERHTTKGVLHLILDGAGYHKAKIVKEKAKKLGIQLHYLLPYSPNLNPIERLWKVMNSRVRNNQFFHSAMDFRQRIDSFFQNTLPEIAEELPSHINDRFQLLDSYT